MTPDEIDFCLRDFHSQHSVIPMLLILNARIYDELLHDFAYDHVTTEVFYNGVKVLRDPLIKGIVVSS